MPSLDPSHNEPFSVHSIQPDQEDTPHIRQVDDLFFKEVPRSWRKIVHYAIHSCRTGELKGQRIAFQTTHNVQGSWQKDPAKSFTLETDEEISKAVRFIHAACGGSILNTGGRVRRRPADTGPS